MVQLYFYPNGGCGPQMRESFSPPLPVAEKDVKIWGLPPLATYAPWPDSKQSVATLGHSFHFPILV